MEEEGGRAFLPAEGGLPICGAKLSPTLWGQQTEALGGKSAPQRGAELAGPACRLDPVTEVLQDNIAPSRSPAPASPPRAAGGSHPALTCTTCVPQGSHLHPHLPRLRAVNEATGGLQTVPGVLETLCMGTLVH